MSRCLGVKKIELTESMPQKLQQGRDSQKPDRSLLISALITVGAAAAATMISYHFLRSKSHTTDTDIV